MSDQHLDIEFPLDEQEEHATKYLPQVAQDMHSVQLVRIHR